LVLHLAVLPDCLHTHGRNKISGTKVSLELKFQGTETAQYGTFVPGNERAVIRVGILLQQKLFFARTAEKLVNCQQWFSSFPQILKKTILSCA